jgi:hypothetical protein
MNLAVAARLLHGSPGVGTNAARVCSESVSHLMLVRRTSMQVQVTYYIVRPPPLLSLRRPSVQRV